MSYIIYKRENSRLISFVNCFPFSFSWCLGAEKCWRSIYAGSYLWRRTQPHEPFSGWNIIRAEPMCKPWFCSLIIIHEIFSSQSHSWFDPTCLVWCQEFHPGRWRITAGAPPTLLGPTNGFFLDKRSQFHCSTCRSHFRKNFRLHYSELIEYLWEEDACREFICYCLGYVHWGV